MLLAVTIAIDILNKRVEMEYLIAQGYLEGDRFWWRSWLIAGGIAIVTFLVPYHRIYNWLKKILSLATVKAIYQLIHDDLKKDAAIVSGIFSIYAVLLVFQVLTEAGTFVCPYIYWPDARIGMPLCTFICGTLITKYHGRQNIYDK